MNDIAVIGAGAWGTALAIVAAQSGRHVSLWARDASRAEAMRQTRRNPRLPDVILPAAIEVVDRLPQARITLLAVPLQHLRSISQSLPWADILVVCAKGIEATTSRLPLEILAETQPRGRHAVLTGPNFASEISRLLPAAAVVASEDAAVRAEIVARLATPQFRLYGNADAIGAQIGGAAKNVIAIAAGAAIGAGLGENARAALITRGLAELVRLSDALGGQAATIAGLSGLGDLLLTCTGVSSRNFSLGLALGQGRALADIMAERSTVAEGVATAPALLARASQSGVLLPICAAVAAVINGAATVPQMMDSLLARPLRDE